MDSTGMRGRRYPVWALKVSLGFLTLIILGFLPPVIERFFPGGATFLRGFFRLMCHGIPNRCPVILGHPAALCYRCSGVYAGLFLGCSLLFPLSGPGLRVRSVILIAMAASVPVTLQWILEYTGIARPSAFLQSATGLIWGLGAGLLLCKAIRELVKGAKSR